MGNRLNYFNALRISTSRLWTVWSLSDFFARPIPDFLDTDTAQRTYHRLNVGLAVVAFLLAFLPRDLTIRLVSATVVVLIHFFIVLPVFVQIQHRRFVSKNAAE